MSQDILEKLNHVSKSCKEDGTAYGSNDVLPKTVDATYGELLPESLHNILLNMKLGPRDVFYDLGCGTGRICLQVYMETGARCTGIEFVKKRYDIAQCSLALYKNTYKKTRKVKFVLGDFFKYDWSDATCIFMCNTCFNEAITKRILKKLSNCKSLRYVFTVKSLPPHPMLRLRTELNTPTSWSESTTSYIYDVAPAPSKKLHIV
jgi:SAM-dependent methyltransferase